MRKAFQMFDTTKCGFIETLKISTILNTMGQLFEEAELQTLIEETDPEGQRFKTLLLNEQTFSHPIHKNNTLNIITNHFNKDGCLPRCYAV